MKKRNRSPGCCYCSCRSGRALTKGKSKSTSARKKKVKRNFTKGVAHIHSTFNNTIVTITDEQGNVIAWSSAGALGYKGAKKVHSVRGSARGEAAGKNAFDQGLRQIDVDVKGPGPGREAPSAPWLPLAFRFSRSKIRLRFRITAAALRNGREASPLGARYD
jgi:small subunit ribosomal protein S11